MSPKILAVVLTVLAPTTALAEALGVRVAATRCWRARGWLVGIALLAWLGPGGVAVAGLNVWTTSGPEGGPVAPLAIDPATPTTLYASSGVGVFKSTNGGAPGAPSTRD